MVELKGMWEKHYDSICNNGLEVGLANLTQEATLLVDTIKTITARYILENEERIHKAIIERNTGFTGSLYGKFNKNLLKQPTELYNCKNCTWV